LKKALLERALGAELTHHLGYEKGDPAGRGSGNSRNGTSSKALLTDDGEIEIEVPRDRAGTFEPVIVANGQTRFDDFDEKIISLYGRATVREIQGHLAEFYGTEMSPDLISKVTDAILDEVREWQSRPLESIYPVVFFDALRVKIRDEGMVKNKAVYVVLGITASGETDVLGLLDRADRRRQILAQGHERSAEPRRHRHPDRRRRRPEGLSRGDQQHLSQGDGPDLHRAFDPQQPVLRVLEGSQGGPALDQRRSIMPRMPTPPCSGSRTSKPSGASAIPGSDRPGGGRGSTSFRSSRSRRRSAR
jgi:hypothetical protein